MFQSNESSRSVDVSHRKFNDLPTKFNSVNQNETEHENILDINSNITNNVKPNDLFELIRDSEIGCNQTFSGPYGTRKVIYCDYTATGRSISFIEDFIRDEVLSEYGNTHTTSTITSLQTTLFRNEAKDIIRNSVNASEHDNLIFAGSGCTAAIHTLVNALDLRESPIVFVSPYEHHSNLLPWREALSEMVYIDETEEGQIDLNDLEKKLQFYFNKPEYTKKNENWLLHGCFKCHGYIN